MKRVAWLALLVACQRAPDQSTPRSAPSSSAVPSALAAPPPPASTSAAPPAAPLTGPVFELRPAVQVKDKTDGQTFHHYLIEPGVLIGKQAKVSKAFACDGPGAPRSDMFGVCVAFESCEAKPPASAEVLAVISCRGPQAELELVRDGQDLLFRLADRNHALAQRPMTRIAVPPTSPLEIKPFTKRYVHAYVDL